MPITRPEAPLEGVKAADSGVTQRNLIHQQLGNDVSFAGAVDLGVPHPIYVLPFTAIAERQISPATLAGWRFPVSSGDYVVAPADVTSSSSHAVSSDVGTTPGPQRTRSMKPQQGRKSRQAWSG